MRRVLTFDQVLDEAECLSIAERTDLVEILHKRMIENERLEIARDVKDARAEYRKGRCVSKTPKDVMKAILS